MWHCQFQTWPGIGLASISFSLEHSLLKSQMSFKLCDYLGIMLENPLSQEKAMKNETSDMSEEATLETDPQAPIALDDKWQQRQTI